MMLINLDMALTKSIIYVAPSKASFVMQDIEWLSKEINVSSVFFMVSTKVLVPWKMIRLFLILLFKKKQDILVSFGGYHAFVACLVAKLKGSKCFIILNGTDSASIPKFNYGYLRGGMMRYCCKKAYMWAYRLLPVSETLISTENSYALDGEKLGVLNEFEDLKTPVTVIPNGFDVDFWKPSKEKKANSVLTVASDSRLVHKGVDLIIELAQKRPDFTFSIAGVKEIENAPENVIPLGFLNKLELRDAYSSAQYYFQLSIWEGFGCALCEAMLCGCIPVVSDVNLLPAIIGSNGYILKKRSFSDLEMLMADIIKKDIAPNMVRQQIVNSFKISNRIELLKNCLINISKS